MVQDAGSRTTRLQLDAISQRHSGMFDSHLARPRSLQSGAVGGRGIWTSRRTVRHEVSATARLLVGVGKADDAWSQVSPACALCFGCHALHMAMEHSLSSECTFSARHATIATAPGASQEPTGYLLQEATRFAMPCGGKVTGRVDLAGLHRSGDYCKSRSLFVSRDFSLTCFLLSSE